MTSSIIAGTTNFAVDESVTACSFVTRWRRVSQSAPGRKTPSSFRRWQAILDREVAGVQPMDFRVRKILEMEFTSLAREEDVVLTPKNDGLRLML